MNRLKALWGRSLAVVSVVAAPGLAFAAAPDTTSITTAITEYSGAAIALVIAFAVAVWGLRAAGLLGRR